MRIDYTFGVDRAVMPVHKSFEETQDGRRSSMGEIGGCAHENKDMFAMLLVRDLAGGGPETLLLFEYPDKLFLSEYGAAEILPLPE